MDQVQSKTLTTNLASAKGLTNQNDTDINNSESVNNLKEKITTLNRTNRYSTVREYKDNVEEILPIEVPIAEAEPIVIEAIVKDIPPEIPEPTVDISGALDKINKMKRELIKDSSLNGILTGQLEATNLTSMATGSFNYSSVDNFTGQSTAMVGKEIRPIHEKLGKAKDVFASNISLSASDLEIINQREQKYETGVQSDGRDYKCPENTVQDQSKNVNEAKSLKEEILNEIKGASKEDEAKVMAGLDDIFKWIAADSKYELQQAKNDKFYGDYWAKNYDPDFAGLSTIGSNLSTDANQKISNYSQALSGAEAEISTGATSAGQNTTSRIQGISGSSNTNATDYIDFIKEDDKALEEQLAQEAETQTKKEKEAQVQNEQEAQIKKEEKSIEEKKTKENLSQIETGENIVESPETKDERLP